MGAYTGLEWLALAERELLLFAGVFFILGALDEFGVDLVWFWLKLTGRARTHRINRADMQGQPLSGNAAVLIPAWREAAVIGATVSHALAAWAHPELRLYIGCYPNDPATAEAARRAAGDDPRIRIIVHDLPGPSTKADCLNTVYRALSEEELATGQRFRMIVLHDAEDMVDPAELLVMDRALACAEFVQIPVRPEPQPISPWVAGHYSDEFTEAHAKGMVVRDALGAALPAAGVGCAFDREILARLAAMRSIGVPFSPESLTEDYELGLVIKKLGGRARFLRLRDEHGQLIATRACFPSRLHQAIRQKTRWIHGIAFQGWDRMGWSARPAELWMRLRDRRGPLSAIVLATAYLMLGFSAILWLAELGGLIRPWQRDPVADAMIIFCLGSFIWRAGMRFAFTTREYGPMEGIMAILRIPVGNLITILAARRALLAYLRSLAGKKPGWDKTSHDAHPVLMRKRRTP